MNLQQLEKHLQQMHLRNIHSITVQHRYFVVSASRCKMTLRTDGEVKKLVDFKNKYTYLNEDMHHSERREKFTVRCGNYSLDKFISICNQSGD